MGGGSSLGRWSRKGLQKNVYCRDQNYSGSGKVFPELTSEKLLIFFLRDGPWLELIIVSSNFQALLLLQDK